MPVLRGAPSMQNADANNAAADVENRCLARNIGVNLALQCNSFLKPRAEPIEWVFAFFHQGRSDGHGQVEAHRFHADKELSFQLSFSPQ